MRFYEPDLRHEVDSPLARDAAGKLVRRSYWLDMSDRSVIQALVKGVGANMTNEEKRAHLIDIRREHLVEQVNVVEILPPER
jgi:hypothetical protein